MRKLPQCLLLAAAFAVQPFLSASAQTPPAFTIVETPNLGRHDYLRGIAALSPDDVWAVGYYVTTDNFLNLAMHWDGTTWTITPTPNLAQPLNDLLKKVTAIASDNVWAIGGHGLAYSIRWDGSQWSEVDIPPIVNRGSVVSNNLQDLASTSSTDIWAVGSMDSLEGGFWTLTVHWNGTEWLQVPTPNKSGPGGSPVYTQGFNSVVALAPNDVWAAGYYLVGNDQHTLIQHWDGTQWSIVPSPDGPTGDGVLNGIAASGPNDIWAVGEYDNSNFGNPGKALTMHWDGTSWTVFIPPNPSPWEINPLYSVAAVAPNDAYAVGSWLHRRPGFEHLRRSLGRRGLDSGEQREYPRLHQWGEYLARYHPRFRRRLMDRRCEAGFFREHELYPGRTLRRCRHDRYRCGDSGDLSDGTQKIADRGDDDGERRHPYRLRHLDRRADWNADQEGRPIYRKVHLAD